MFIAADDICQQLYESGQFIQNNFYLHKFQMVNLLTRQPPKNLTIQK